MVANQSLWVYFVDAGMVVKTVMLILLVASVASWALIFQRGMFLKRSQKMLQGFEERFWSGVELSHLYSEIDKYPDEIEGTATLFHAGFREYVRARQQGGASAKAVMENVQRVMRIASAREIDKLEQHLPFLASVGSTSPYIGLLGTVWGIMTSFHALGNVQQATIAMVAPGISEALIATAMGLFAAIPAVLAYNRYSSQVERIVAHYDTFQDEFSSILQREFADE